jgi:sulfate transport system permease protein
MSAPDARVLRGEGRGATRLTLARYGMRGLALTYLALLLAIPLVMIFVKTFEDGLGPPIDAVTSPDGLHAFWLTLLCVGIAVPLNTVFGVLCALVLVRQRFPGRGLINSLIDLPFAVSPVVIGLALFLVWGKDGWLGGPLADAGIQVIFSTPGLILATVFVSLPFVVREVQPVLQEIGTDQEQAAETLGASGWQTFWRVTLP